MAFFGLLSSIYSLIHPSLAPVRLTVCQSDAVQDTVCSDTHLGRFENWPVRQGKLSKPRRPASSPPSVSSIPPHAKPSTQPCGWGGEGRNRQGEREPGGGGGGGGGGIDTVSTWTGCGMWTRAHSSGHRSGDVEAPFLSVSLSLLIPPPFLFFFKPHAWCDRIARRRMGIA